MHGQKQISQSHKEVKTCVFDIIGLSLLSMPSFLDRQIRIITGVFLACNVGSESVMAYIGRVNNLL